jgi:hypothetical protein
LLGFNVAAKWDIAAPMERTEIERMRQNEETFARANEQIRSAAERLNVDPVPFLCECSATNCTDLIHMPLEAYRAVRKSIGFMIRPGHDDPHVETVVEDHGTYQVVEKFR